jgi:hypothetical protein
VRVEADHPWFDVVGPERGVAGIEGGDGGGVPTVGVGQGPLSATVGPVTPSGGLIGPGPDAARRRSGEKRVSIHGRRVDGVTSCSPRPTSGHPVELRAPGAG